MSVDTSHLDEATEAITLGDAYGSAMDIDNAVDAGIYLRALVRYIERVGPATQTSAEIQARGSLGYWAGYYDHETRQRVEELFNCEHPVLGKARDEPVSANAAFAAAQPVSEVTNG